MKDFIDLQGASGATYRFRLWLPGAGHLPIAGNYVCVDAGDGRTILGVGQSMDLSRAREELPKRLRDDPPHLFTRLNVARATREAEHEDLAAAYGALKTRTPATQLG